MQKRENLFFHGLRALRLKCRREPRREPIRRRTADCPGPQRRQGCASRWAASSHGHQPACGAARVLHSHGAPYECRRRSAEAGKAAQREPLAYGRPAQMDRTRLPEAAAVNDHNGALRPSFRRLCAPFFIIVAGNRGYPQSPARSCESTACRVSLYRKSVNSASGGAGMGNASSRHRPPEACGPR